jgi:hypothetical protein
VGLWASITYKSLAEVLLSAIKYHRIIEDMNKKWEKIYRVDMEIMKNNGHFLSGRSF